MVVSAYCCLKITVLLLLFILVNGTKNENGTKEGLEPKKFAKCSLKQKEIRVKPKLHFTPVTDIHSLPQKWRLPKESYSTSHLTFEADCVCWFCSETECGKYADVIELLSANTTDCGHAAELKRCCPHVKLIKMDNKNLCDCFCAQKLSVRGSGKTSFVQCSDSCPDRLKSEDQTNSDPAVAVLQIRDRIQDAPSNFPVLVVSITSLVIVFLIAVPCLIFVTYCYCNKRRGITTMFNNVNNCNNTANGNIAVGQQFKQHLPSDSQSLLQQTPRTRQLDECTEATSDTVLLGEDHNNYRYKRNATAANGHATPVGLPALRENGEENAPSEKLILFSDPGANASIAAGGGSRDRDEMRELLDQKSTGLV